jgi:chromosomal replication initiator protein
MTTTAEHPRQIWDAALGQLQLHVTRPNFETWLKNTVGVAYRDGEFVVGAPNAFVAEMLEQRMYSLISRTLESVVKSEVEIRFEVTTPEGEPPALHSVDGGHGEADETLVEVQPPIYRPASLNSRYTFERFVVGKSNELAHAAADAVSGRPGELYNPLVLYSDVGLGKTHLMHAIGHRATSRGMSLIYSTTEEFTNSYIRAIREGTTDEFRERYRSADLLLLDDVQFLIGKEQTQEGFFHTFNALHMTNRQIVLTSDRPVSALTLLEDRIQSRLAGGLVVDIQPPDVETRIAILRAKAEEMRQEVPDPVLQFLAERIHKNIRELEGSLNRVVALADLTGAPVSIELTRQAVADVVETAAERKIPDTAVVEAVSSHFGVSIEAIKGRKRDKRTAQARQVAMYLLREESQLGLSTIGKILGGKNHNTIMHGCDRIANQLKVDPQLRRRLINIRESLSAH